MKSHNILLISDGSRIFPVLSRLLVQVGYQVCTTFYGRRAFQALRTGEFQLVLTNLNEDWSDKRPFMEEVRRLNREISVIFLSTRHDVDFGSVALLAKTDGYHFNPQGWHGLRHLLTDCLNKKMPLAESTAQPKPFPRLRNGGQFAIL
jgi:DNA-binding response OmpR family regulator